MMNLHQNSLSGTVPDVLSALTKLQYVFLFVGCCQRLREVPG